MQDTGLGSDQQQSNAQSGPDATTLPAAKMEPSPSSRTDPSRHPSNKRPVQDIASPPSNLPNRSWHWLMVSANVTFATAMETISFSDGLYLAQLFDRSRFHRPESVARPQGSGTPLRSLSCQCERIAIPPAILSPRLGAICSKVVARQLG